MHEPKNQKIGRSKTNLWILVWMAFMNLRFKRLRTFLTISGIVIGIGAVVFLVSLSLGLHNVVNEQVVGSRSIKTVDVTSPNSSIILINNDTVQKVQQFAHVTKVAKTYLFAGKISYQGSEADTLVYGSDPNYLALSDLTHVAGDNSLPAPNDSIINTALLKLIGISTPTGVLNHPLSFSISVTAPDGTLIKQASDTTKVVGVVNSGGGAELYTSDSLIRSNGAPDYSQLKVVVDSRNNIAGVRSQIAGLGLTTASPIDTLNEINKVFTIFTYVVAGFGSIGMIIAVLGTFNTLTISLLERTSEIGLMVALGARKADVKRLLVAEALLLSFMGGAIGVLSAWLVGFGIDEFLLHLASSRGVNGTITAFSLPIIFVAGILLFAMLVGALVAYYPSRRAGRINPIDALRHE